MAAVHSVQGQGGYYSGPTYSGGIATLNSLPSSQRPYFLTPGPNSNYVSTYYVRSGDPFPSSCNGQITTQFVWFGSNNNGPAPKQVIVSQSSTAEWDSYFNFGQCNDGLGDPSQITLASSGTIKFFGEYVNDGTSTGTHYSIVSPDANGNIELYCTPTASSDLVAYVGYAATAYPITVDLTGTTLANGVSEALTGQKVGASLSLVAPGSPYKVSNLTWSMSGATGPNPIKNWDYGAPGDGNATQVIPLTGSDYTPTNVATPFNFYDSNPDTVTVKCTGTVTFPDGTSSSFSAASLTVTFKKPMVTLWNVNTPLAYTKISGFGTGLPSGPFFAQEVWDSMTVTLPAPFNQNSQGLACIAQVGNIDRAWYRNVHPGPVINPAVVQRNPEAVSANIIGFPISPYPSAYKSLEVIGANGVKSFVINPTALDTGFPYQFGYDPSTKSSISGPGGYIWPAGELGYSGDHPSQPYALDVSDGGGNFWYSSVANDSFTTWIMYQPPTAGSIWVPLQSLTWRWGGVASKVNDLWDVSQTPIFFSTGGSDTNTYPTWTQTIPVGFTVQP